MFVIRQYTDEDLNEVVALWYQSWTQAFPNLKHPQPFEQWKFRFQNDYAKQDYVWVATIQDRIVGFVVVSDCVIAQIFVEVKMQGGGVGTALLNHAKTLCPMGLTLTTLQQNEQARRFYEKHGFVAGAIGVNSVNGQPNIEYYWKP
jgi:GNAT superfamily N-acetyltransferase